MYEISNFDSFSFVKVWGNYDIFRTMLRLTWKEGHTLFVRCVFCRSDFWQNLDKLCISSSSSDQDNCRSMGYNSWWNQGIIISLIVLMGTASVMKDPMFSHVPFYLHITKLWVFLNVKFSHTGRKTVSSGINPFPCRLSSSLQEMLAIMKSIYDMMGRYTYPCVRDEAPSEHVDKFFQVLNPHTRNTQVHCATNLQLFLHPKSCILKMLSLSLSLFSFFYLFNTENGQKQRWCSDHWRVHRDLSEGDSHFYTNR